LLSEKVGRNSDEPFIGVIANHQLRESEKESRHELRVIEQNMKILIEGDEKNGSQLGGCV
jgi:hypothetical protein